MRDMKTISKSEKLRSLVKAVIIKTGFFFLCVSGKSRSRRGEKREKKDDFNDEDEGGKVCHCHFYCMPKLDNDIIPFLISSNSVEFKY